jgi:hypothetical protein
MLKKSTGKTTDTRGCEFHYQRLFERGFNAAKCKHEQSAIYVCVEFPEVSAPTLKELKEKMGAL